MKEGDDLVDAAAKESAAQPSVAQTESVANAKRDVRIEDVDADTDEGLDRLRREVVGLQEEVRARHAQMAAIIGVGVDFSKVGQGLLDAMDGHCRRELFRAALGSLQAFYRVDRLMHRARLRLQDCLDAAQTDEKPG